MRPAFSMPQTYSIEIITVPNADEAAIKTARHVGAFINSENRPVLGLATGRTMLPVYAQLRTQFVQGTLSFANCESFNLDEYCDLPADDPSSFAQYMRKNLFDHVDIAKDRVHLPDPANPALYDTLIAQSGGIGLQLLGIGRNGHIGFNEPGTPAESKTHIVELDASTRAANAADFPSAAAVPHRAVTMGLKTILAARRILLLATGKQKAEALHRAFREPVDASCPASYLQNHPHVTVICDHAAAAELEDRP